MSNTPKTKAGRLLRRLELFFITVFAKEFELLKKNSEAAVKITNSLKSIVESPILDVATYLIPGDLDDKILTKARNIVPRVAMEMAIAHGIIQQAATNQQVYAAIVEHIRNVHNPEGRVGFWLEFSARLNQALADGKIEFGEAASLAQIVYLELKRQKEK